MQSIGIAYGSVFVVGCLCECLPYLVQFEKRDMLTANTGFLFCQLVLYIDASGDAFVLLLGGPIHPQIQDRNSKRRR